MESNYMINKEKYASPEVEVILIQAASTILSNEGGQEGDEHGWDQP